MKESRKPIVIIDITGGLPQVICDQEIELHVLDQDEYDEDIRVFEDGHDTYNVLDGYDPEVDPGRVQYLKERIETAEYVEFEEDEDI